MKKKLLSLLMAVSIVAVAITGCGAKENDKEDEKVESVEDDAEDDDTEDDADKNDSGNVNEEKTEGPIDDGMIEVEGEVTVLDEDENSEEENSEGEVVANEWATAYDDYFSREGIISENVMVTMSMAMEGMVFDIKVATVDEQVYMSYDFGTAALDMYVMEDVIYACTKYEGVEEWIYAPVTDGSESESMFSMTDTSFVDTENATSCTYREEVVENGVVYDVLDVELEEDGVTSVVAYYVNRETQKIEKCVVEQDGVEAECYIVEIESIELPAEAANATEGTEDDIMGALLGIMFMGMGM